MSAPERFANPAARVALCWLLLVFVLTACARHAVTPDLPPLKLAPDSLGEELVLQQRLRVERAGEPPQQLEAVLMVDARQVALAGLVFGQRVLTLEWDGRQLTEQRHPLLPATVQGERVLHDVMLIYWPRDVIAAALPDGWRLEDDGRRRVLYWQDQPQVQIDYPDTGRYAGEVVLRQLARDYQLTIDSAVQ